MSELSRLRAKLGMDALALLPFESKNFQFVKEGGDLGTPVEGVITLEAGKTYFLIGDVDLMGARIETGGVVTLIGTSSETASLTSTGLPEGVPLLTSRYTMPVRFLTFKDVHTGVYIDDNGGSNAPLAIDWFGVNFLNVSVVGEVGTVDNFIYDTGAFLSSQGLKFTGSTGTVGMSNSLFQGDGSPSNILEIAPTASLLRRFRITYSSIISFGSSTGILVDPLASIPVEGFILDTLNFSGGSTYVSGITSGDNKSRWLECRGVLNSNAISGYHMNGNTTPTTISAINTEVKASGVTTSSPVTQKFTNTNNRATYTGAISRDFKVTSVVSCLSGNNNQVGLYIAKNGVVIQESEVYITTNATGRAEGGVCQVITSLSQGDYVEVFLENSTATVDVTLSELNVIVEPLN